MERHDPSRRPFLPSQSITTSASQSTIAPTAGYSVPGGPVPRFRQSAYLQDPPSSPPSTLRAVGEVQQAYGFPQGASYGAGPAMPSGAVQYGQELQTPETPRQPVQQYPQYGSQVLYGMGQSQPAQSPYDQVPQYRSRTNTGSETLAPQFGVAVPQTANYWAPPTQSNTSAPELSSQPLPSQYPPPDPYQQPGSLTGQPYPGAMMDQPVAGQYGGYVQQSQYQHQPQPQHAVDHGFERYEQQIRTVFTYARDGSLREIGNPLIDASLYLLGNAENLGLARDEEGQHDNRLRLWEQFNRAWLVTLQRQFDMTQEMLRLNQRPREPLSVMSIETLERLGQELIRLCDNVEKHGLVDYEMGVAEEEIIDLLLRCLSLLEPPGERSDQPPPPVQASSSTARGR